MLNILAFFQKKDYAKRTRFSRDTHESMNLPSPMLATVYMTHRSFTAKIAKKLLRLKTALHCDVLIPVVFTYVRDNFSNFYRISN